MEYLFRLGREKSWTLLNNKVSFVSDCAEGKESGQNGSLQDRLWQERVTQALVSPLNLPPLS
ncbi:MAG: hypothetical protein MPJ24_11010, partial [Pirellulaceae bacterium]|nr:hypothetical protein [Pirellulaceae bacterium]